MVDASLYAAFLAAALALVVSPGPGPDPDPGMTFIVVMGFVFTAWPYVCSWRPRSSRTGGAARSGHPGMHCQREVDSAGASTYG